MTASERALMLCVRIAQESFPSTFTLDGSAVVFTGTISEEPNAMQIVAGGSATDGSITIEASRDQFEVAELTPAVGGGVLFSGRRYVITGIPGLASDPTSYRMICEVPQKGRGR